MGGLIIALATPKSRTRFSGYSRVESPNKALAVSCSRAISLLVSPALLLPQVGIHQPGEFSPLNSIKWFRSGSPRAGRGTLFGAIIRAFHGQTTPRPSSRTFSPGKPGCSSSAGLFVLVTLLLAKALVGLAVGPGRRRETNHEKHRAIARTWRRIRCSISSSPSPPSTKSIRYQAIARISTVGGTELQALNGFKALNNLNCNDDGETALHHRPQRRRQKPH